MTIITSRAFKQQMGNALAAAAPAEPRCPHAGECGGCAYQDRAYPDQVAAKASVLRALWQQAGIERDIPVIASPDPYAYRTRMDYVATKGRFGLRMRGKFNFIVDLETCHLIPPAAFAIARRLWERARATGLPDYDIRRHTGFLRYIVVRRSPQDTLLLAAVTASDDDAYLEPMEHLAQFALQAAEVESFHWLLNDSLTDLSFGETVRSWGSPTLLMQTGELQLHIGPNTFFQNNVHLLLPLLDAVRDAVLADPAPAASQRIADLYSGVGAIALHLAPHVANVVAVEAQAQSTELARRNVELNRAPNVTCVTFDVAEFVQGVTPSSFDTIVADPPRTGLGAAVCAGLRYLAPRRIVYVSCNPLTQVADVQHLLPAYRLVALTGYDMFPHTPHVESLAVLERISLQSS